ncbi:MAG: FMN-binding glutamate synthase family protein [Thermaerobacter sp.]|nr:FMN-binding glutamate synthase family protein [Thermaerobacter sp.]
MFGVLAVALATAILTALVALLAGYLILRGVARRAEVGLGKNPNATLWEFLFSLKSHSLHDLALTMQRAEQGQAAEHPLGSVPKVAWLEHIGFDPATLGRTPLNGDVPVAQAVRLGPRAGRPLELALPVVIAPMGYGVGLADRAKIALAQAASLAGSAVVSGEGPYLPEERGFAERWILQLSRAAWAHQQAVIDLADMVEIQWGQASEAGIGLIKNRAEMPERAQAALAGPLVMHAAPAGHPARFIQHLRALRPELAIGVKLPASHHLEEDLNALLSWGVDVITLDGAAAGSAGSPAVISDHFGISTALAVHRAHRVLLRQGQRQMVSLIASGGVEGAADIAKLLALGADAVAVGSALLFALGHEQVARHLPASPPTQLLFAHGPRQPAPELDLDRASEHATAWFAATRQELATIARALGLATLQQLNPDHLLARTAIAAEALNLAYDAIAPDWSDVAHKVDGLVKDYGRANRILTEIDRHLTLRGG